ncbi:MAG: hypothetical protein AB1432_02355 [Bacteroidota bacterium]
MPIIFSVLKIVAFLAALVITLSYVAYRIRLKKGKIESSEKGVVRSAANAERTVKRIVERITKHYAPPQSSLSSKPEMDKKIILEHTTKGPVKKVEERVSKESRKPPKPDRIEVVKPLNPQNFSEKVVQKPSSKKLSKESRSSPEKNMASLGDQILDKYAEDQSADMFALSTKKKDSQKNN